MDIDSISALVPQVGKHVNAQSNPVLLEKARELESAFLSEMLTAAGVGKTSESFGGGAGEEAFSSFMVRAYADQMSQNGGIGLAESIVRALTEDAK